MESSSPSVALSTHAGHLCCSQSRLLSGGLWVEELLSGGLWVEELLWGGLWVEELLSGGLWVESSDGSISQLWLVKD